MLVKNFEELLPITLNSVQDKLENLALSKSEKEALAIRLIAEYENTSLSTLFNIYPSQEQVNIFANIIRRLIAKIGSE